MKACLATLMQTSTAQTTGQDLHPSHRTPSRTKHLTLTRYETDRHQNTKHVLSLDLAAKPMFLGSHWSLTQARAFDSARLGWSQPVNRLGPCSRFPYSRPGSAWLAHGDVLDRSNKGSAAWAQPLNIYIYIYREIYIYIYTIYI